MRTQDADAVARALGLRTLLPANWRAGLAEVRDRGVFVAPLQGFVLTIGKDLLVADADAAAGIEGLLVGLSSAFGEAAWFQCHGDADLFGWARAARGELRRAYAFACGTEVWSHGEVTAAEAAAGCFVDDPRDSSDDELKWWPDESLVRKLAAAWAVDPGCAPEHDRPGCGMVGRL